MGLLNIYGAIQGAVEPRLQQLIATPGFAQGAAAVTTVQAALGSRLDAVNARALHTFNLPAGTDVKRLRRQIGELDREIRMLRMEFAQLADGMSGRA